MTARLLRRLVGVGVAAVLAMPVQAAAGQAADASPTFAKDVALILQ